MSLIIKSYYNIKEARTSKFLREFYAANGDEALFIVPAGLDREAMLDVVCGESAYFGVRPAVRTLGDLLGELAPLAGDRARVIDPPDHNLILRFLMDEYLREMEQSGITLAPGVYHGGFVSILGDNIKDLLAEEVSPERLERVLFDSGEPERSRPEALLIELYRRYLSYLEEHCLADAAQTATLARRALMSCEAMEFMRCKKPLFAGFLSFTGSQLRLIRALSDDVGLETVMLQPETGLDDFHDGIRQLGAEYEERPRWNIPVVKIEASNSHLELESLAREFALWGNGTGGFSRLGAIADYGDIGLMVSPDRLSIMEYALDRYNIPFNVQVRGTVAETLPGELPTILWRAARSGWDYYHTSILVSTPLLFASWDGGISHLQDGHFPFGCDGWMRELRAADRAVFKEAADLCRKLEAGGSPREILSLWLKFLENRNVRAEERAAAAAGEYFPLDGVVKETAYAIYELKKKIKNLEDEARDIGPASDVRLRGDDAVKFIRDWGTTATMPIQLPQSRSLTLYAGMPPILASHRFWVMCGVDYDRWPGMIRESMLLGNDGKSKFNGAQSEEDEKAHLPELREEREQKEAVFRRLAATARDGLILSRSLTDSSKAPVADSPFVLSMLADDGAARRWNVLAAVTYPIDDALPDGGSPWFPQAETICTETSGGRAEKRPPEVTAAAQEKPVVRVSDIDTWAACPYRYWCMTKARLESPSEGLRNPRLEGTLVHRIWEEAFAERAVNPKLSIQRWAMDNWQRLKEKSYPALDDDTRLFCRERYLMRHVFDMAALLDETEERAISAGRTAVKMEAELPDCEINGVIFRAKADRIDYYDDGAVILDYKLGKVSDHIKELQIPAYGALLSRTEQIVPMGFCWLGHRDCSADGWFTGETKTIYAPSAPSRKMSLSDRIAAAEETMAAMAESVKNGRFTPKYKPKDTPCKSCPFFVICRKREDSGAAATIEEEMEGGDDD